VAAITALGLFRAARRAIAEAAVAGIDWRQVVDGLRPVTVELWRGLPDAERRRFLRHLARRWEVARHRWAPDAGVVIDDLLARGQLQLVAARIMSVTTDADGVRIELTRRGRDVPTTIHAAVVVDCTGPAVDPAAGDDPLLHGLLASGVAQRDPLGLGLRTSGDGAVIDGAGQPSTWLFALGVLRRGSDWESTAVPELRAQAAALAERFAGAGAPVVA
jgi:uncharacterized NAD(P)/FAD-binding protein YdhS